MASQNAGRYKDKVVIVTGGSSGIGEGCVRVFARNGGKVVFCSIDERGGHALHKELEESVPGNTTFVHCDVTKDDDVKRLIDTAIQKYGKIDCLINNAGRHNPPRPIDAITEKEFQDLINLNVLGYFRTAKHTLPFIRKTKGCIINNASMVAHIGQPLSVDYVTTKGAISAFTKALAIDEAQYGVRVNAFSPSNVWTPMWEQQNKQRGTPLSIQKGIGCQLMGRMGNIEEVGELCLYLAAEATFMTGVDVPFSGGAELTYGIKSQVPTDAPVEDPHGQPTHRYCF